MIDSHAHLFMKEFDADRAEVLQRAREGGVEALVNVGIDVDTSRQALDLARARPEVYAALGLHPSTPIPNLEESVEEIRCLARSAPARVVAIGEIGLDFYWKDVTPEDQDRKLRLQLDLAGELGLPVIIHCRDALPQLIALLDALPGRPPGVFHCFAGGPDEARRVQALGFHISFAGNVTYPKAANLRDAARAVAPDRLLLETDCPFLSPQERRGKRNEPFFATFTRDALAIVLGRDAAELGAACAANTRSLFSRMAGA